MTTGLITPTARQMKQFKRFKEDAEQRVVFDKDGIQRLLANGGKFQSDYTSLLEKYLIADSRFNFLTSFNITVPKSYNHDTQLATFAEYAKKEKFYYYNEAVTDDNFFRVTNKLMPGETYGCKIFSIKERVSSKDCLSFLASQQALLVGAQGLSLVRQLKKSEFPIGKWTVSFDELDALWEDADGGRGVPYLSQHSDGDWNFNLGYFASDWNGNDCLLCLSRL